MFLLLRYRTIPLLFFEVLMCGNCSNPSLFKIFNEDLKFDDLKLLILFYVLFTGFTFGCALLQDTLSNNKAAFDVNKLPIETQNLLAVCKRESMAEYPSPEKDDNNCKQLDEYPSPQTDNPKPFSLIYKRRRHNLNSNNSNVSGDSIRTSQDPCSSTITTAATALPTTTAGAATAATNTAPKKHFLSALVEFSLQESLESKESLALTKTPDFDAEKLESSMPPSSAKFIKNLQSEVHKLAVEKETMRFEMMSAQAMINILQSRVDILTKENEDLKRMAQNP